MKAKYAIKYTVVFYPSSTSAVGRNTSRETRNSVMILELLYEEVDETTMIKLIKEKLASSQKVQSLLIRDIRFLIKQP